MKYWGENSGFQWTGRKCILDRKLGIRGEFPGDKGRE
ncbi:MAG: hypothetical protein O9304_20830 [Microcystis sp. LE19-114.1B]|nr:hypothetical protein [Microcystis aeruginosa]MCZ8129270.1 hypothetical protein [Microcystis sp. LE19-114.1B]